jgi:hypothetical protein
MVRYEKLAARVSVETKRRAKAAADRQYLKSSEWLRRLIAAELGQDSEAAAEPYPLERCVERTTRRLTVRVRPADVALLKRRGAERGMLLSTYASVLIRSQLRTLAPLPKREILALRRAVSHLGSIARSLSWIADGEKGAPEWRELRSLHSVCQALRDQIKVLLKANAAGWAAGEEEAAADRDIASRPQRTSKFGRRPPGVTIRSRHQYPNSERNIRNSEH